MRVFKTKLIRLQLTAALLIAFSELKFIIQLFLFISTH